MTVMAEYYRKPFRVYLVINKYTVPSANDDRVFIPGDRVTMIPISVKPKATLDDVNDKYWLDVTITYYDVN